MEANSNILQEELSFAPPQNSCVMANGTMKSCMGLALITKDPRYCRSASGLAASFSTDLPCVASG
jgi:hypothetical protein